MKEFTSEVIKKAIDEDLEAGKSLREVAETWQAAYKLQLVSPETFFEARKYYMSKMGL